MKLASFRTNDRASYGLVQGDMVADCGAVLRHTLPDLAAVLAAGACDQLLNAAADAPRLPCAGLEWLPVIPRPDKILCVGLNYATHRHETGSKDLAYPAIFTRFFNSQVGHRGNLILPRVSSRFDYEGELAVIIGTPARAVSAADAPAHVAGYAIYLDGSVRDFQSHTHQFTPGKNFPATGGLGPWLVTPDEMGPVGPQRIATTLNGNVVQDAHLSDMIFDVARIIEYCSSFTRLEPGDVIATGTPGGVGARRQPPLWMRAGDTVEVTIDGIGTLSHQVAAEV